MSATGNPTIVHWFRKGLRLHDNPALLAAIEKFEGKHAELRPVFVLDPWIVEKLRVGPNRWRFLQQSLQDLDSSLRAIGTRLYVVRGKPEVVFRRLFTAWDVKLLTFETDIEPYAVERDDRILDMAMEADVRVIQKVSHTLHCPRKIIAANLGKAPLTYQRFLTVIEGIGPPDAPLAAPKRLPEGCRPTAMKDLSENFDVPTLVELGVAEDDLWPCLYPGGETEALRRMAQALSDKQFVRQFSKPDTAPTSLAPSTTVLSPYLKFGCLSPRLFYARLAEILAASSKHTRPPVSLTGQLLWREFFYTVAADTDNFDKMAGNSVCTQIPWDTNKEWLEAWAQGKTGYPWIDAAMTQLRQEGWIHHLARHAVACFLTRGDLWLSWEEGQKVFEELLLDADWALNAGNWMWLSASAFFRQFFRVYSPVAFPRRTDKAGEYVRRYVPALRGLPAQYVYEPWRAPADVLRAAGCRLGVDYPHRIVIHEEISKVNISRMSEAYAANKARASTSLTDDSGKHKEHNPDETVDSPKMKKAMPSTSRKRKNADKKMTDFFTKN